MTGAGSDGVSARLQQEFDAEADRLLEFARASRSTVGGFGHLDARGRLVRDAPIPTYAACRMVYCFALSTLRGRSADRELVEAGVTALRNELHDPEYGGWWTSIGPDGRPLDERKSAYAHAFVVLAAAAATVAQIPDARELLIDILAVVDRYFWDDVAGVMRESYDRAWRESEPYRGANANMHSVEALLAAADATGDIRLLDRADRIAARFIDGFARRFDWRLPEHYSETLEVLVDYNRDDPMHHFRPYGVTPGHLMEWARLCLQLGVSLAAAGRPADWPLPAARGLYDRAVADGWSADGSSGFVYTTDFEGRPVARTRMYWVIAEAMGAAAALHSVTGEQRYLEDLQRWWREASLRFADRVDGSWHHALDEQNVPDPAVWGGKPDVYHALQAVLLPGRSIAPSLPVTLARESR